jgi:hypothetical protein
MTSAQARALALEDGYKTIQTGAGWVELASWPGPESDGWSYRPGHCLACNDGRALAVSIFPLAVSVEG